MSPNTAGPYIMKYEPGMVIPQNAIPIKMPIDFGYVKQKERPIRVQVTKFKVKSRAKRREVVETVTYSPLNRACNGEDNPVSFSFSDLKINSPFKLTPPKYDIACTRQDIESKNDGFKWAPYFEPFIGKTNYLKEKKFKREVPVETVHNIGRDTNSASSEESDSNDSLSIHIQLPEV